jgi:hypothetical protein
MQPALGSHISCNLLFLIRFDLSSLIFHRLRQDPKLGVAYFFFNHSNRDETAERVIRALLAQIVAQSPRIPGEVTAEYSRYINDPHRVPTIRDNFAILLQSSVKQFSSTSPVFILIDAYDEFRNSGDEEGQRTQLCSALSEICRDDSARLLITTRPQCRHDLKDFFPLSQIAVVKGDLADVEKYLEGRIQPLKRLNDSLKSTIKETVLEANREEAW